VLEAALKLCAQSQALTARARQEFLLLAEAETEAEKIAALDGFARIPELQRIYGEALFSLMWGWRHAQPLTQQNFRKAQSLVRKVRALPLLEADEELLLRWLPEILKVEPAFAARLKDRPSFASSLALQEFYAGYVASSASQTWTAPDAYAKAEEIKALRLFGQSLAPAYVLALGHVVQKAGPDDVDLLKKVLDILQGWDNPAPAMRAWDALVALRPEEFTAGRRDWLRSFGLSQDATVGDLMRMRMGK